MRESMLVSGATSSVLLSRLKSNRSPAGRAEANFQSGRLHLHRNQTKPDDASCLCTLLVQSEQACPHAAETAPVWPLAVRGTFKT